MIATEFSQKNKAVGQLCDGTVDLKYNPVPVSLQDLNGRNITGLAVGPTHFVVITQDGKVFSCGGNDRSQLGIDSNVEYATTIQRVHFAQSEANNAVFLKYEGMV